MERWRYGVMAVAAVLAGIGGLPPARRVVGALLTGDLPPVGTTRDLAALAWVAVVVVIAAYLSFRYFTATPADGA